MNHHPVTGHVQSRGAIHAAATCSAWSLFTPAAEVPVAILAKTLGTHVQVAVQWQKISAGDWAAYAADVSRRSTRGQE